jgi:hypothetical protein
VTISAGRRATRAGDIPFEIEDYRDERWCREAARSVQTVVDAERFIENVGFATALTDAR